MCRRAMRVAMRRISCMDQRIRGRDDIAAGTCEDPFGGVDLFVRGRMTASMAKASITSETCRCQPCQERVSLWSVTRRLPCRIPQSRTSRQAYQASQSHRYFAGALNRAWLIAGQRHALGPSALRFRVKAAARAENRAALTVQMGCKLVDET
jgi:hypothetical protein